MKQIQRTVQMLPTAAVVLTTLLAQNFAFAYDAVGFASQASNQNQAYRWLEDRMRTRFEKASPEKRERIMTRYEKRGNKILAKLMKTSDEAFQNGYDKLIAPSNPNPAVGFQEMDPDVAISREEEGELLGEDLPQQTGSSPRLAGTPSFTRTQAIEKVTSALRQIQDWKRQQQSSTSSSSLNRAPAQASLFAELGIFAILLVVGLAVGFIMLFLAPVVGAIIFGGSVLLWLVLTVATG
jgi:hypothetical protein